MYEAALQKAVDLAGGQSALARALSTDDRKLAQGHVWAWLNRDKQTPVEHCPGVESVTGVRCEDLRPDVAWNRDKAGRVTGYTVPVQAA